VRAAAVCAALAVLAAGGSAGAEMRREEVRPWRLVVEEPTIRCLGVRWYILCDANENATVAVSYRRKGQEEWREALPLLRVGPESLVAVSGEMRLERPGGRDEWPFQMGNLFAGSVFDLDAGAEYEIKLELSDPDGGSATEVVEARTRVEPRAPEPERVVHVGPGEGGGTGAEGDPLRGLAAAEAAAQPGDLMLVHAGVYEGTFVVRKSGERGRPIVWRAAGDGEVVIDGCGAERGVSATDLHDVFFEGLSIRNSQFGMVAHRSSDIVVRGCHFYGNEYGFTGTSNDPVMRRFYIADNVFEGPSVWPRSRGIEDARAVQVCGEGHVVCYNRVRGFGDGIDIMYDTPNRAIDIYGNEISECTDDAIEMDFGETNVRAFRNRITNCFEGISTQPVYGGPCYIFRNAMYNLEYTAFKLHNAPSGVLLLHNTSVKAGAAWPLYSRAAVRRVVSRNNVFVGTEAEYGMEFSPEMIGCDLDWDGFGGGPFARFGKWEGRGYETLEGFREGTGMERHGVWLGEGSPFAAGVQAPRDYREQFPLGVNDLRPAAESAAIDAGEVLPNVNDGYAGEGPDLGAYEHGEAMPGYGARQGVGR
jgi:hypothetical protein